MPDWKVGGYDSEITAIGMTDTSISPFSGVIQPLNVSVGSRGIPTNASGDLLIASDGDGQLSINIIDFPDPGSGDGEINTNEDGSWSLTQPGKVTYFDPDGNATGMVLTWSGGSLTASWGTDGSKSFDYSAASGAVSISQSQDADGNITTNETFASGSSLRGVGIRLNADGTGNFDKLLESRDSIGIGWSSQGITTNVFMSIGSAAYSNSYSYSAVDTTVSVDYLSPDGSGTATVVIVTDGEANVASGTSMISYHSNGSAVITNQYGQQQMIRGPGGVVPLTFGTDENGYTTATTLNADGSTTVETNAEVIGFLYYHTVNADGSVNDRTYNLNDGSMKEETYATDGIKETTDEYYTNGSEVHTTLLHNYGNPAIFSTTTIQADGSWTYHVEDKETLPDHLFATNYIQDVVRNADGSGWTEIDHEDGSAYHADYSADGTIMHGSMLFADGSSSELTYHSDGSWDSIYKYDVDSVHTVTTHYDPAAGGDGLTIVDSDSSGGTDITTSYPSGNVVKQITDETTYWYANGNKRDEKVGYGGSNMSWHDEYADGTAQGVLYAPSGRITWSRISSTAPATATIAEWDVTNQVWGSERLPTHDEFLLIPNGNWPEKPNLAAMVIFAPLGGSSPNSFNFEPLPGGYGGSRPLSTISTADLAKIDLIIAQIPKGVYPPAGIMEDLGALPPEGWLPAIDPPPYANFGPEYASWRISLWRTATGQGPLNPKAIGNWTPPWDN